MPTGGGKSLCYQLPGLATEDLTIVVSPLIALMNDQWRRLTAAGHPVAMITSAMSEEAVRRSLAQVRGGEARIVYCSPERFGSNVFLDAIEQRRIDLLAVDEAHCVSEWGHDFRPDYLRLPEIAERLGRPTVMACTATATEAVAREIAARFEMREPLQVRSGFDRPNLSFDVVRLEGTGSKARRLALLEAGLADPANRPAIVYCGTRKDTDEVAATLREAGLRAAPLPRRHGGRGPRRAPSAASWPARSRSIVATNAFGMGVDKADVRSVWHMAIPTSLEAYYQEAGRGGRDGLPAKAVLLAMKADLGRLVRFNEQRAGDPDLAIARERGWRDYRTIKSFIYSERCRRRSVLDHFSDGTAGAPLERCCDVCDPQGWLPDPETIAVRRKPSAKKAAAPADRPLRRRRAPVRAAEGVAPTRRRRQARLHGRPQLHPGGDAATRPASEDALPGDPRESARASSPSTRPRCWRSSPRTAPSRAERLRQQLGGGQPARLRGAGPRRKRRVEHIDVDHEHRGLAEDVARGRTIALLATACSRSSGGLDHGSTAPATIRPRQPSATRSEILRADGGLATSEGRANRRSASTATRRAARSRRTARSSDATRRLRRGLDDRPQRRPLRRARAVAGAGRALDGSGSVRTARRAARGADRIPRILRLRAGRIAALPRRCRGRPAEPATRRALLQLLQGGRLLDIQLDRGSSGSRECRSATRPSTRSAS